MARRRIVRRDRNGRLVLALYGNEAAAIAAIMRDLLVVISEAGADSPLQNRLFPRAYLDPTEEAAEQEWQSLVHDDLVEARRAMLHTVIATLDPAVGDDDELTEIFITGDQEQPWITVLNDARLATGTALNIVDDDDPLEYPDDDPRRPIADLYNWLTYVHLELIDALLAELPETGIE